jgi:hypothetical protein
VATPISPRSRLVLAEAVYDLLGPFGLAEAHQGEQQQCPHRRGQGARRGQVPGQAFGGPERGQRVGIPAARQLELGADVVDRQRHRGIGFRSDSTLGALQPGIGLAQPPLPGQHGSERHVSDAGGRLVGPAVPLGQVDRPPA